MAAWQFQFSLVPEAGIKRVHGELVSALPEYGARDPDGSIKEITDFENYWDGIEIPPFLLQAMEDLLPERASWDSDARMFGSEGNNSIEVWSDDINCCIDMKQFEPAILATIVEIAQQAKCKIVLKEGGRVIDPVLTALVAEANRSAAKRFVEDPITFITQRR